MDRKVNGEDRHLQNQDMKSAGMNALARLASLDEGEKDSRGVRHTPGEIARQASFWEDTAARVLGRREELMEQLRGRAIVLAGAGSSDFVGRSVQLPLRQHLGRWALAIPTTSIVTDSPQIVPEGMPCLVVLFSRSGDSPESLACFEILRLRGSECRFLAATCNPEGALARLARKHPDQIACIVLDPATCDQGLAMTGSFTNMVVAGQALAYLERPNDYLKLMPAMKQGGEAVLRDFADMTQEIARAPFQRAVFLGSGALYGAACEAALKLQEMTDGQVITKSETFVGLRHGPKVVIDRDTLVVCFVSSAPSRARYELDLMAELRREGAAMGTMAVAPALADEAKGFADWAVEYQSGQSRAIGGYGIPDDLRPPVDVIIGQMLGLFKSLDLGLRPDEPSARGLIHRVVQGVRCYADGELY